MKNLILIVLITLFSLQTTQAQKNGIPKKAAKYFQDARLSYTFEKREEATEFLRKAIKAHSKYIEAIALLGKIESELGNFDSAIAQYEKVIELSPKDECKGLYQIGKIYMLQENYPKAISTFQQSQATPNCQASTVANAQNTEELCVFRDSLMRSPVVFNPIAFDTLINTEVHDYLPMLTADGEHLFFTKRLGNPPLYNEDFYEASKDENGNWQKATDMGAPINTEFNEGALTISPDGKRLFFAAVDRFGGEGNFDIWYSYKKDGKWIRPLSMGRPINSPLWESQPSISADGKELFFAAKTGKGEGSIDIWVSRLVDNIWQAPENLGKTINTAQDDQCPYIHPDGRTLYFASNGHKGMGSSDLFVVRRNAQGEWGEPQNLGYPINTLENENSLFVSADGKTGYYSQFINSSFDLVSFDIPKHAQPAAVTYVKGTVASSETKLFIPSKIEIYDAETSELIAITKTDVSESEFLLTLPIGKDYMFGVESDGFYPHSERFSLAEAEILKSYELELFLNPIVEAKPVATVETVVPERKIVMKNIQFETNSAELKSGSFIELNKIVNILNENSSIKMQIEGHTDNVGDEMANLNLSKKRAEAVKQFLIENGITSSRLTTIGKGETEPIDSNETKEGRANNRRTEFVIKE